MDIAAVTIQSSQKGLYIEYLLVKRALSMVALTLFRVIRACPLKNSKKNVFSSFGVFKPYEYINFVSRT